MRRWLLPLIGFPLMFGGCAQAIAEKLLTPMQSSERAAYLAEERRQLGRRVGERLKAFDYRAYDNTHLAGLIVLPETKTPRGVIVVLHGLTDSKEAMLDVAETFADAGYIAVAPDLRAHGTSDGRYTSLGYHEKRDQMALLDYLEGRGCDVSHAGVIGGSLGAAVALQWAAIDPRVKAVVAVAPFAELRSELRHLYKSHDVNWIKALLVEAAAQQEANFRIDDVSPLNAVRATRTPVLLAHGTRDDIIPVAESKRLFAAATGPVVFQEAPKAKHVDIRDALGDAFTARAVAWMNAHVPAATAHPDELPGWAYELPHRNLPAQAAPVLPLATR